MVSHEGVKTVTELKGFKSGKVYLKIVSTSPVRGIQQNSLPAHPPFFINRESSFRPPSEHLVTL
jgi:hypothetical protein